MLLHRLPDALRRAGVDREQALDVLVALVVGVDLRELAGHVRAGRDHVDLVALALERRLRAVDARLDVRLAGRRDEEPDAAALRHERRDALAHLDAGVEEILADVGEPLVGGRAVGVVGDDRDAGLERLLGRRVERLRVDDADRDAVGLARDRRVHRVDHLGRLGRLRARPLVGGVRHRARVLGAVARRHEERVRRHVVDEHEAPLRVRRVLARRCRQRVGGERRERQSPDSARESRLHHPSSAEARALIDLAHVVPFVAMGTPFVALRPIGCKGLGRKLVVLPRSARPRAAPRRHAREGLNGSAHHLRQDVHRRQSLEELGLRPARDRRRHLRRRRGHRERVRRDDRDGDPRARGHLRRARSHAGRAARRAHAPRRLHRRRADPPRRARGDRDRLLGHRRQERRQARARAHGRPGARQGPRLRERLVPGRAHARGHGRRRPRRRRAGLHRAQVRPLRAHLADRRARRGGARDRPHRGGARRHRRRASTS